MDVAQILCHELCHAALGPGCGHGPKFKAIATLMGLGGKMTATVATDKFNEWCQPIVDKIGPYPHDHLDSDGAGRGKKQPYNKHVNLRCPKCDYYAKTTRDCLEIARLKCPSCRDQVLQTQLERMAGGVIIAA